MRRVRVVGDDGPLHERRKALWTEALRKGEVPLAEVEAAAPDHEQRNLLLISLRLAGVKVKEA